MLLSSNTKLCQGFKFMLENNGATKISRPGHSISCKKSGLPFGVVLELVKPSILVHQIDRVRGIACSCQCEPTN